MKAVVLRIVLLANLAFLGAFSLGLFGAVLGPLLGVAVLIAAPRALRSTDAFAPP